MKDKASRGDIKTTSHKSAKSKSVKGLCCTKSGTSSLKASKHNRKNAGINNEILEASLPSSCPTLPPRSPVLTSSFQNKLPEALFPVGVQSPSHYQKLHLQLFPIDDATRKFLEEENHCPYLELTITSRKKISSVIKHLQIKWANSTSASQELMLFPYNARLENLATFRRWTSRDSDTTAADVHEAIGKPTVFRLRYGWFSILEPKICSFPMESCCFPTELTSKENTENDADDHKEQLSSGLSQKCGLVRTSLSLKESFGTIASNNSTQTECNQRSDDAKLSWVDCVSNISFGALFSEVEAAEAAKHGSQPPSQNNSNLQQFPISCDSFDAAIAAHIATYRPKSETIPVAQPSILDSEETCNPFSFRNLISSNKNSLVHSEVAPATSLGCTMLSPIMELAQNDGCVPPNTEIDSNKGVDKQEMQADAKAPNEDNNMFQGLDMHWPPSAGPWQFMPSPKQINGDSNGFGVFVSTNMDIL
ncbi:hypothetical protein HPP92_019627 [Vanilla planifolia]|uniref:TSL-kinase interacting protein 1 n=1 Tax=Vanilla planifolia TaxID=51239 RepID=A0A835Q646_VANPL|nr:hypothetical protein HPP92_019627 [Vanilla planifolia]